MKNRDYKKENEKQAINNKMYSVKIPRYLATPLDEKLKKEGLTFSQLVKSAIEKYLKKT